MRSCAFLTMDDIGSFVTYDDDLHAPLAARGWRAEPVSWRADADWDAYEAVVIRSPWDYQDDPAAFLAVLEAIDASSARLLNPLDIVRWNLDKRYLRDLDARGLPVVPTAWPHAPDAAALGGFFGALGADEIVVKPVVGAGAADTFRLRADGPPEALAEAARAFVGRHAMVQPFVQSVVSEGEFSVFSFGGAVSHTILKTPKAADFRVQEEHGGLIRGVAPEPALLRAADAALAWLDPPLLYARVDLVRLADGRFAIMELELIEPSLYFPYGPGSAERFAEAFVRYV
jgi:glutathione synthase/RimK-type ligase-like ATP-grasp enzyme